MSPFGTPRRFAALPKFGSDRSEADMKTSWRTSEGDGVAHTVGAVTALLEREDYTRVAWYVAFTHPRAGGAYDSHHRMAGIAGCTRRRGCRVAARGTRARALPASMNDHSASLCQCSSRTPTGSLGRVLRSKRTGKTYARSEPYRFGNIHSTCLWRDIERGDAVREQENERGDDQGRQGPQFLEIRPDGCTRRPIAPCEFTSKNWCPLA